MEWTPWILSPPEYTPDAGVPCHAYKCSYTEGGSVGWGEWILLSLWLPKAVCSAKENQEPVNFYQFAYFTLWIQYYKQKHPTYSHFTNSTLHPLQCYSEYTMLWHHETEPMSCVHQNAKTIWHWICIIAVQYRRHPLIQDAHHYNVFCG